MRSRVCRGQRGFTLLEVLVAVIILAIGVVSAMELFGGCMRSIAKADLHTKAVFLAKKIIDNDTSPLDVEYGETNGDFEEPFDEFKWKKTISVYKAAGSNDAPAADGAGGDGLHVRIAKITVAVSYARGEEDVEILSMDTLKVYFDSEKDSES